NGGPTDARSWPTSAAPTSGRSLPANSVMPGMPGWKLISLTRGGSTPISLTNRASSPGFCARSVPTVPPRSTPPWPGACPGRRATTRSPPAPPARARPTRARTCSSYDAPASPPHRRRPLPARRRRPALWARAHLRPARLDRGRPRRHWRGARARPGRGGRVSLLGRALAVHPSNPDGWLTRAFGGFASLTGLAVTAAGAESVAAVFAAVRILSETVASLPIHLYQHLDEGGKERAITHPLYQVLRFRPNPWQTPFEFWEMLVGHTALRGNGYAQKLYRNDGQIDSLIPLHPDRLRARMEGDVPVFDYFP